MATLGVFERPLRLQRKIIMQLCSWQLCSWQLCSCAAWHRLRPGYGLSGIVQLTPTRYVIWGRSCTCGSLGGGLSPVAATLPHSHDHRLVAGSRRMMSCLAVSNPFARAYCSDTLLSLIRNSVIAGCWALDRPQLPRRRTQNRVGCVGGASKASSRPQLPAGNINTSLCLHTT